MITRRRFLAGAASTGLLACSRGGVRTTQPRITHGVQSGDVQTGAALVWARCDEPARMLVEWDTSDAFANPRRVAGPVVTRETGLAATVALSGLPDAQTIAYRVKFERDAERGASAWETAHFATPDPKRFRFAWTGDTAGQGFGRNLDWGGMRGYQALRAAQPAFFLHSGDLIYGDNPIPPELKTHDGRTWTNVSNDRVARVAQELDDFRARFQYNLEDEHVRALARDVPILAQWDDHETHNNWWPGQQLDDDRYTIERDATKLSGWARRAMVEWTPVPAGQVHRVIHYGPLLDVVVLDCRSFRTPNDTGTGGAMLGDAQVRWMIDALATSRARWKIVACDQPIGVRIPDGPHDERIEGWADGTPAVTGREHELVTILGELHAKGVDNIAWLTADVHYPAVTRFTGGPVAITPFHELIAGPIHAGGFPALQLDTTFAPELLFQRPPPVAFSAPWDGFQSFGTVDVAADAMVLQLWGITGNNLYKLELPYRA